jgi:4-oxalocrotonate tautomerase
MAASTPAIGNGQELVTGGLAMPYVNIKVTREGTTPDRKGVSPEQKAELIKGVSELLLKVLNKPMDWTFVVIDEVEKEDWGVGGLPVDAWRQRNAAKG